mgnify:CR=1 FL=1
MIENLPSLDVDEFTKENPIPDYPPISSRPTEKEIRNYLQKFIQYKWQNDFGISFTQGVTERLANEAAGRIMLTQTAKARREEIRIALLTFSLLARSLKEMSHTDLTAHASRVLERGRIDAHTIKQLRRRHSFCGIRPYC